MKTIVIFLCFSFIAVGCKKPINDATMKIHAYNALDNSGVDSIFVSVSKQPSGDVGNTKKMASGYTDESGNLTLIYSKTKLTRSFRTVVHNFNSNYIVIQKYLNGNEWNGDGQIGGKKETDIDIQCAPIAGLDLDLINQNCYNANDSLFITEINLVTGDSLYNNNWNSSTFSFQKVLTTGCFQWGVSSSSFYITNAGNRRYYGYIKRDNGITYFDTTIFVQPGIDNFIELFF